MAWIPLSILVLDILLFIAYTKRRTGFTLLKIPKAGMDGRVPAGELLIHVRFKN